MMKEGMRKAIEKLENKDERAEIAVIYYLEHGDMPKPEMIKFLESQIEEVKKSIKEEKL